MVLRFLVVFFSIAVVSCGSSSQTTTAPSQTRCAVQVQGDSVTFSPDGGTGTARVTTNRECNWSARSDASWVALTTTAAGQGDGSVSFRVAANSDPGSRAGGIVVEGERLQISQAGRPCSFGVSSALETVGAPGGERTVEITASSSQCRWTAATDVSWIVIASAREGSGSGAVTFRVEALTGAPRAGTVTIGGNAVRVEQGQGTGPGPTPGCSYSVEPRALEFDQGGGARDVFVTTAAGCSWSASTSTDWVSIAGAGSGSGPGGVRVSAAGNSGSARTAMLRVADQTIAITQGSGCSIALNPVSASVPASASTGVVQVGSGAGCAWAATTATPWIAIADGANGSGSGQVRFSVAANAGPARDGAISIGGRTFAIAQASGCTYSISPASQDVAGAGGAGTASVTTGAGCTWNAASNAEWIALGARSGVGPGQVAFTVSPNNGPARTGTFSLAGSTFTINQASPCTWTFIPPLHRFDANGGNGAILVIVTGPCAWTATTDAGWITITAGATGTGNGLVQFVVAPNAGAARTGWLAIGGALYEVSQGGR
ncbi:MAG TPA: BACON domain-containing carbohydrate-binding protein [Vicinamibacterales bacterium]